VLTGARGPPQLAAGEVGIGSSVSKFGGGNQSTGFLYAELPLTGTRPLCFAGSGSLEGDCREASNFVD